MKLKLLSLTSGGKDLAVQAIEREYIHQGNDHLRDDITIEKVKRMNSCTSCCSSCWSFIIFVFLLYSTIMYFKVTNEVGKMA